MSSATERAAVASCRCGKVKFEIAGPPILAGICYCNSCQQAGRLHQALPGADPVLGADSGTSYVLYRKDRVRCVAGGEQLDENRLKPESPTRRLNARCCNTAMFLDFTKGALAHGLSRPRPRRCATTHDADDDRRAAGGRGATR